MSSVLTNCYSLHESDPENAKVMSIVDDETIEKMETWLNLWIHKMIIN